MGQQSSMTDAAIYLGLRDWGTIRLEKLIRQVDLGIHDHERGVTQPVRFDIEVLVQSPEGGDSVTWMMSRNFLTKSARYRNALPRSDVAVLFIQSPYAALHFTSSCTPLCRRCACAVPLPAATHVLLICETCTTHTTYWRSIWNLRDTYYSTGEVRVHELMVALPTPARVPSLSKKEM